VEKQEVLHIVCVCVFVALVIQHAMRMRRLIQSSVTCVKPKYLPTLSHKRGDFRKQRNMYIIEHKMCVLILSANSVLNISHSKKNAAAVTQLVEALRYKSEGRGFD
jgi:hypothetical protein